MRGAGLVRRRAVSLWVMGSAGLMLLAGCGTQTSTAVSVSGSKLTIYVSQPPGAASQATTDVLDAERLAFQQGSHQAGKLAIELEPALHGAELSDNARAAIQDKSAIAYLGELVPGTSGTSVQITNEEGLLEVSPVDTSAYLTQPTTAVSGAPGKYYPSSSTYHQTFARVVPSSEQEAKAVAGEMHSLGLTKVYVSPGDGSDYGDTVALEVRKEAASQGLSVLSGAAGADAVFYGGMPGAAAAKALDQAAVTSPGAKLFASSALYDDSFTSRLSTAAQRNLYVSSPGFVTKSLTSPGRRFVTQFTATFHHAPAPQAIFGYEAMAEILYVLHKEGSLADDRANVVSAFRTLKDPPQSVLGAYAIVGGDTNIAPFIFGRPVGGKLVARPPA